MAITEYCVFVVVRGLLLREVTRVWLVHETSKEINIDVCHVILPFIKHQRHFQGTTKVIIHTSGLARPVNDKS